MAQRTQDDIARSSLDEAWTCCPLCDVWYPLAGPINYFRHLLQDHAETRAAGIVSHWLDN